MVRVKVCGIQRPQDVAMCVRAGVDALGFIFAESPRRLTIAQAQALTTLVPPFITKVGVFAHNSRQLIQAAIDACALDLLQFSGGESAQFCGSFNKPTIVVVRGARTLGKRELRAAHAAAVLIDSADGKRNGGTGQRVQPAVARVARQRSRLPFILAGGLTPANVAASVAAVKPWAVDVRSGVERRGHKSARLIQQFVAAAKGNLR